MQFFDFHHHHLCNFGIYNVALNELPPEKLFSLGLHPKDIDEHADLYLEKIKNDVQNPNCVAIGECGLDARISIDEKIQEKYFEQQIEIANTFKKPLIIHCVRRFERLPYFKKKAKVPMIIHGFNKNKNTAEMLLKNGFYLSFGRAALQNVSLQEIIKNSLIEQIFLETDDADFPISELYEKVAKIKNLSINTLQEKMLENFEKVIAL